MSGTCLLAEILTYCFDSRSLGELVMFSICVLFIYMYGKCPKISNTLKFRTPNIFAQNNFWKCPKISNSSNFAKRGFLKFRTQLSSSDFLLAHSNFGNVFFFFFFSLRN